MEELSAMELEYYASKHLANNPVVEDTQFDVDAIIAWAWSKYADMVEEGYWQNASIFLGNTLKKLEETRECLNDYHSSN
jgi:hypothetical protein